MTKYAPVGDVGGTNARLALCEVETGAISRAKTFSTSDYDNLEAVIRHYLDEQNRTLPTAASPSPVRLPATGWK